MKKLLFVSILLMFLASCGGNSTTGAQVEESEAGMMIPDSFVGVYVGSLTVTAEVAGIFDETDTFDITVTVTEDGMVLFEGDDPDETFTVGLTDEGTFSGNIFIDEDPCEGVVGALGAFVGDTVSGTVDGEGVCSEGLIELDADLEGTFSATRI